MDRNITCIDTTSLPMKPVRLILLRLLLRHIFWEYVCDTRFHVEMICRMVVCFEILHSD